VDFGLLVVERAQRLFRVASDKLGLTVALYCSPGPGRAAALSGRLPLPVCMSVETPASDLAWGPAGQGVASAAAPTAPDAGFNLDLTW
jgi:hypothetical protein